MLPLNDLPEPITPATVKRYYAEKLRCERLIFLALCSETDRLLLEENAPVSLLDFERITYLLETLGLSNLCNYLQMNHQDLFEQLANGIEKELSDTYFNLQIEISRAEQWQTDFCEKLPTEDMKHYMSQLFYIDLHSK